ncbi:MAG: YhgE/Pip domain-containing protein [Propioniciclava sp.]
MTSLIPNRPGWATWLVLLLVPVLVAGGLLWGTGRSDERLRDVQAAVVNLDEMVTINDQPMPLGRQLAAEIVNTDRAQNVNWVLADAEQATAGLDDGTYAAVVTIPENFSAAATSFAKPVDEAEQATIQVDTSQIVGINETALGQAITYAAVNSLNEFLAQEYLTNLYLAFNDQSTDMLELVNGTRELADGADQLADGTAASVDGARQLATGLQQAATGGSQLHTGAQAATAGATDLSAGASTLAEGATAWQTGAQEFATGLGTYAEGVGTYAEGSEQFASGVEQYAEGVEAYAGGINGALNPVLNAIRVLPEWGDWAAGIGDVLAQAPDLETLSTHVDPAITGLRSFVQAVQGVQSDTDAVATAVTKAAETAGSYAAGDVDCPDSLAEDPELCAAFQAGAEQAGNAVAASLDADAVTAALTADGALSALNDKADGLLAGLDTVESILDEVELWLPRLEEAYGILSQELPEGQAPATKAEAEELLGQLIDAGDQLTSGGEQLATGARGLADGADQLAGGADQLAEGATGLADGSRQLVQGMGALATGTAEFATGIGELAGGIGRYTAGINGAAQGASQLADGLGDLSDGLDTFADGSAELADGVAEGQQAIPTYTDAEAATMALSVDEAVANDGLAGLVRSGLAWTSLLLILALWLGALATFAAIRPIRSDALTARAGNLRLLGSTLLPGLGIVTMQAILLTGLGAAGLGLTGSATLALGGVLLVAGVSFTLINQALAALLGHGGRIIAVALMLLTAVMAATSAAPPVLESLAGVSPSTPALAAVRAIGVGTSPAVALLTLVGWGLVAFLGLMVAIHRARTVRPETLLT